MDECQHDKCHMGFDVLGRSLRDGGNTRYNEQTQNAATCIKQLQPKLLTAYHTLYVQWYISDF